MHNTIIKQLKEELENTIEGEELPLNAKRVILVAQKIYGTDLSEDQKDIVFEQAAKAVIS